MFSQCSDTIIQKFAPYTLHSFNFKYWILNTYSEWLLVFDQILNPNKKHSNITFFFSKSAFKVRIKKNLHSPLALTSMQPYERSPSCLDFGEWFHMAMIAVYYTVRRYLFELYPYLFEDTCCLLPYIWILYTLRHALSHG